ncbi:hypothetical protein LIER_20984 [Lithospermum erythrorhizon]|uniref:Transmembrane protein n=1 Tax=Lithospermum erythrorhizon TaxID=34254 RepID=A0AAV3QNL9_LITER
MESYFSDLRISQENEKDTKSFMPCSRMVRFFQLITITLLSLLLPLGFLLLARFTTAHYLHAIAANQLTNIESPSFVASYFLKTDGTFEYILVGIITSGALIHSLAGRLTKINQSNDSIPRRCLYAAWIFLCFFQVSVCFGIEGSISAGVDGSGFSEEKGFIRRVVFFLGLHETMRFWSKVVVKPVVDDTLIGFGNKERWIEKAALAVGFGMLWWWRLRDEVEALVVVVEVKRVLGLSVGGADFAGWWLYYLTVVIGVVKVVKSVLWVGVVMLSRRRVEENNGDICDNDGKV